MPWTKSSTFNPRVGQNEALESFLFELDKYLFDPKNSRKVKDNLTQLQRRALKRLSTWNVDPQCDRMFRIQDKGSWLVLEDKYREKMLSYLEHISMFKEETEDPCERNKSKLPLARYIIWLIWGLYKSIMTAFDVCLLAHMCFQNVPWTCHSEERLVLL